MLTGETIGPYRVLEKLGEGGMEVEFAMSVPGGSARPYHLAPDGRFFIIRNGETETDSAAASNLIVVQNWTGELKRLVPRN